MFVVSIADAGQCLAGSLRWTKIPFLFPTITSGRPAHPAPCPPWGRAPSSVCRSPRLSRHRHSGPPDRTRAADELLPIGRRAVHVVDQHLRARAGIAAYFQIRRWPPLPAQFYRPQTFRPLLVGLHHANHSFFNGAPSCNRLRMARKRRVACAKMPGLSQQFHRASARCAARWPPRAR